MCRSFQGTPYTAANEYSISSAYVPVSHFIWTWKAGADPSGTGWVVQSAPTGTAPQLADAQSEQPTSVHPQWTANNEDPRLTYTKAP